MRTHVRGLKTGVLVPVSASSAWPAPVVAHHSFDTEYEATKKVKLTGVMTWSPGRIRICACTSMSQMQAGR